MTSKVKNNYGYFIHMFNGVLDSDFPAKEDQKISFNTINGDFINIYKSTKDSKETLDKILAKIRYSEITKKIEIIEPSILFDSDFLIKYICSTFNANRNQIKIQSLTLSERKGNKSTYLITAYIYPEIYPALKKPFSLEDLYFEFVGASSEEKRIIVEYLNSLEFKKIKSVSYFDLYLSEINQAMVLLSMDEEFKERREDFFNEATRNSSIIGMFNIKNPLLDIEIPTSNTYVDKIEAKRRAEEAKNAEQLKKDLKNLSPWINEDIDG